MLRDPDDIYHPRGHRRFLVNQPARLYTPGKAGCSWSARICDISRRGMQFVVDGPVSPVPHIAIEWNGRRIPGVIRHQRQQGKEYRLGVELIAFTDSLVIDMLGIQAAELREANQMLQEQTEALARQAALLDLTYDAILVTTISGIVSTWNCGAEQMYGWTKAEAHGRGVHALLKTVFPGDGRQIRQGILSAGRWEGELQQVRKDGSRIVVASRWALQRGAQGLAAAIMAINSDISAQKLT